MRFLSRTVLLVGAGVILVGLIGGGTIWSYIKTAGNEVGESIDNAMPVDFELKRARTLLRDLKPEIKANMMTLAKAEAAVAEMNEKIGDAEGKLDKSQTDMLRLTSDLESANGTFMYASRSYTRDEVKSDLENRFKRHTLSESTLDSWIKQREAREKSLSAARRKFNATLTAKRELETAVELLAAKWAEIQATKTESNYQIDDGQLGRVKKLVQRLESRIKVEESLVSIESANLGEIPLEETVVSENIAADVRAHFEAKNLAKDDPAEGTTETKMITVSDSQ